MTPDPALLAGDLSVIATIPVDATDPIVVVIAWFLTQAIARWGMGHESRWRAALPYIAMGLAVGIRVVVGLFMEADVVTGELVLRAFAAGAAATWGHSATPQAIKAFLDGGKPEPLGERDTDPGTG